MNIAIIYVIFALSVKLVSAACPVCVIGAGATFWIASKLGISNIACGAFMGTILTSSAQWIGNYFYNRGSGRKRFTYLPISYVAHFTVIIYIYQKYITWNMETIHHIDSFALGLMISMITSLTSFALYGLIKKLNNNKPHFNYQKVFLLTAFTVVALIISSKLNKSDTKITIASYYDK